MEGLVGGVNSPVRNFKQVDTATVIARDVRGVYLTDQHGRRYVDYIMGWGTALLGHRAPSVYETLCQALNQGWLTGLSTAHEGQLAEALTQRFPSCEQFRFCASGTEATTTAVRMARAITGRSHVILFSGCYHGHTDGFLVKADTHGTVPSSAGVLPTSQVTVLPYNDHAAVTACLQNIGTSVACIMIEPIVANMGVVLPAQGFLHTLHRLCQHYGIMLIFDEVVTGLRVHSGGAQGLFGVIPHLTTLGKIIGGGLPIGAVGGSVEFMSCLAPIGPVYHAGTFAGHPLAMAAGLAVLKVLSNDLYQALHALTKRLADGVHVLAKRHAIPLTCQYHTGLWSLSFQAQIPHNYTEVHHGNTHHFKTLYKHFLKHGILLPPSPYEACFLSCAHQDRHVDALLEVMDHALPTLITG
jgi:glutamate-1-semialdehyde 2,1-aminomutase